MAELAVERTEEVRSLSPSSGTVCHLEERSDDAPNRSEGVGGGDGIKKVGQRPTLVFTCLEA